MPLKLKVSWWSLNNYAVTFGDLTKFSLERELDMNYPVIDQFSPARRLKSSELSELMKFFLHKVIVHLRR